MATFSVLGVGLVCGAILVITIRWIIAARWPKTRVPLLVPPRRCHVRTVAYADGIIQERHSHCQGELIDLDELLTDDARIVKDTAHEWVRH